MSKKLHHCEKDYKSAAYGHAIDCCSEDENGYFWVGNGEYANQVNYCPFCGAKAVTPAEEYKI